MDAVLAAVERRIAFLGADRLLLSGRACRSLVSSLVLRWALRTTKQHRIATSRACMVLSARVSALQRALVCGTCATAGRAVRHTLLTAVHSWLQQLRRHMARDEARRLQKAQAALRASALRADSRRAKMAAELERAKAASDATLAACR